MELNLSLDTRNARLQALVDQLDSGSGAGKFLLYTGPKPAAGAAITTETLLGTCVLSDPAGTVDEAQLSFSPISDDISADADGDIAWVRGVNSEGTWVLDMDAGDEESDALVKFNTVVARTGGVIQFLSGVLTEGNG
jgi:hypothetical protein